MNNAGPVRAPDLQFRFVKEQSVDQCSRGITRPWVHHEPGRFVQDDDVIVFVQDVQRDVLGGEGGLFDFWQLDENLLSRGHFERLPALQAIDSDKTIRDQPLQIVARSIWKVRRQVAVESGTGVDGLWLKQLNIGLVVIELRWMVMRAGQSCGSLYDNTRLQVQTVNPRVARLKPAECGAID